MTYTEIQDFGHYQITRVLNGLPEFPETSVLEQYVSFGPAQGKYRAGTYRLDSFGFPVLIRK